VEAALARRDRGLSSFHARQEILTLGKVYESWTEELLLSVLRGDSRFRLSQGGAVGLAEWGSTRVPTQLELLKNALDESGGRVSVDAVMARFEANYGRIPARVTLAGIAQKLGAGMDGDSIARRQI
jgi:hypothetical protein